MGGHALARLWRGHRLLVLAFVAAIALTVGLGSRMIYTTVYWSQHRDAALAPWMTLGFVARSWDLDRAALADALGLDPEQRARLTLEQIAARTGRSPPEVIAILEAEIEAARRAEEAQ